MSALAMILLAEMMVQGSGPEKVSAAIAAPARTDQFGDPLPAGASARLGTVRLRHSGPIHSLVFSPDSKTIASLGDDWALALWDTATGREQAHIPQFFHALAFAPDGRTLTTAWAGTFAQWDLKGKKLRTLRKIPRAVRQALTVDGTLAALERQDLADRNAHEIVLWDLATGKERHRFKGHTSFISALSFSRNGKVLVSQGRAVGDPTLVWDVVRGRQLLRLEYDGEHLFPPALAPDGGLLAIPGDKHIALWDITKGKLVRKLKHPNALSTCAAFTSDGRILISDLAGSRGNQICLWRVSDGEKIRQWTLSHDVQHLAISPDDKLLAAVSEYTVCLFDITSGKELHAERGHRGAIETAFVTAKGRSILTCSHSPDGITPNKYRDHSIQLWDGLTGRRLRGMNFGLILAIAGSPDGRTLAVLHVHPDSWDEGIAQAIGLWDFRQGKEIRRIDAKGIDELATLTFSPDGKTLVSGGKKGFLYFWDVATGKRVRSLSPKGWKEDLDELSVTCPRFSPDGRSLAAAVIAPGGGEGGKTRIHLWDFTLDKERPLEGQSVWRAEPIFSSDGKMLAVLEKIPDKDIRKQRVRLYEVESGQPRDYQLIGSGEVYLFALAPGGEVLATVEQRRRPFEVVEYSRRICLWDIISGEKIGHVEGHRGSANYHEVIRSLAFSADGRTLVSGGADTTALVWDISALVRGRKRRLADLSPRQLEALWSDLDSRDSSRVSASLWKLISGRQTAAFLKERLHPVSGANERQMTRHLAELDSAEFTVRERATQELVELGESALLRLRKRLANRPTLEMRRRIEDILAQLPIRNLRPLRAIEILEHIGSGEARQVLQTLAEGMPEVRLTQEAKASLQRLKER